tara:strand:- start:757 stop:930 length:174 start_codon:yes stop_codon:yes gene_type:complete
MCFRKEIIMNDALEKKIKALDDAIQDVEDSVRIHKKILVEKQEILEALRDRRVKYSL